MAKDQHKACEALALRKCHQTGVATDPPRHLAIRTALLAARDVHVAFFLPFSHLSLGENNILCLMAHLDLARLSCQAIIHVPAKHR